MTCHGRISRRFVTHLGGTVDRAAESARGRVHRVMTTCRAQDRSRLFNDPSLVILSCPLYCPLYGSARSGPSSRVLVAYGRTGWVRTTRRVTVHCHSRIGERDGIARSEVVSDAGAVTLLVRTVARACDSHSRRAAVTSEWCDDVDSLRQRSKVNGALSRPLAPGWAARERQARRQGGGGQGDL